MYNSLILPDLQQMLRENDVQGMTEFCRALHAAVAAEILEELSDRDAWTVVSHSQVARQVEILRYMSLHSQVGIVQVADRDQLSKILEEMAPDDRVDIISRLDHNRVEQILPLIAQAERNDIRRLLSYAEDSAGSIMTTEYASLPLNITVAEALEQLRQQAPDSETIYYVYILDEQRHLRGLLSLREILFAAADSQLTDIMRDAVVSVPVDADQEFVARQLARYNFIAIPVVDSNHQLVGIITHDDVLDVVQEEATEDAHRLGAVEPLEDSYLETKLMTIAWKRGGWLLFLAVVALFTAELLNWFRPSSDAADWMILFLPLVLASGGNAGSQSATLVIRTIALGEVLRRQGGKLVRRELLIGSMLGLSLACVGFIAADWWFELGWIRASVVGLTVFLVVLLGTVCGVLFPLLFRWCGMDPALMSNPLIAALIDVVGVAIYYGVRILIVGETPH
ncbi:MAG: magnesium transporter [Planctomycetaceae bacterium]